MRIRFIELRNFRKLEAVRIDFTDQTTVFVGPNNSGKTSAMTALQYFLVNQSRFTPDDFTASNWQPINKIGSDWEAKPSEPLTAGAAEGSWRAALPSLDIWLDVSDDELHHVSQFLPTLDWAGGLLGVRLQLEPKDIEDCRAQYLSAVAKAKEMVSSIPKEGESAAKAPELWPGDMRDFLKRRINALFTVRAYALDPAKQTAPKDGLAQPQALPAGSEAIEGESLKKLIRIDIIPAHRDLTDTSGADQTAAGGDSHERRQGHRLSAQLRSYYDRHLDPQNTPDASDLDALEAIQSAQELFDEKLRKGFSNALSELENLGYPGVANPKLTIATNLRLIDGLNHDSAVKYDLNGGPEDSSAAPLQLPENYNGLGYQNLISIAFKLMSFRDEWMQVGKAMQAASSGTSSAYFPPPLHLVLIEEPEAHLHAQVQQVFIRQAYGLLRNHAQLGPGSKLATQLIVSTHSSHIAHECEFAWLRYFRRLPASKAGGVPIATVVNLSEVFGGGDETQRFITRYLKATHCDLFFADAAIFVEGPAERILVPQFLRNEFPQLRQCYITILEIGGSHAHRLKALVEHLSLTTLVITDIDSAESLAGSAKPPSKGKGYVTRNATIRSWHPQKDSLDELLELKDEDKVKRYGPFFSVRIAYQHGLTVSLGEDVPAEEVFPYTFEDGLVFENLALFKTLAGDGAVKRFRDAIANSATASALAEKMFAILKEARKAEFALDILYVQQEPWPLKTPAYIRTGLIWLQGQLQQKTQGLPASKEAKAAVAPVPVNV